MRELLLQKGVELKERDFFQDRLSGTEIRELAASIGLANMFAWRSPSLKQMGLAGQDLSEDRMLELMLQEPRLVRRPVVKINNQVLVGGNLKAIEEALSGG